MLKVALAFTAQPLSLKTGARLQLRNLIHTRIIDRPEIQRITPTIAMVIFSSLAFEKQSQYTRQILLDAAIVPSFCLTKTNTYIILFMGI